MPTFQDEPSELRLFDFNINPMALQEKIKSDIDI